MSNTVKKLIFTSSFSTILDGKKEFAGEEDAPSTEREKHQMAYSATKAISERIVLSANKANEKLLTCAIRPAFIFGEKDKTLINEVTRITGKVGFKRLPQWKDKKTDFVHMENLIDAHLLAEEKLVEDSPVPGQAYFITNNEPVNFLEFLSKLGEGLGYPIRDVSIPFWILAFLCQIGEWWYNLHGYLFGFSLDYAPGLTEQALNFLTQNFECLDGSPKSFFHRYLGFVAQISLCFAGSDVKVLSEEIECRSVNPGA
jgi:nucleoside-diphosphate-sugar epimerase